MPNIGPLELVIVLVILLVVLGPKRLPGLGKQLGTGMREFKESVTGGSKDDDEDSDAFGRKAIDPAPADADADAGSVRAEAVEDAPASTRTPRS
jgi:sec-independent protein translocase protein TatA